jgi:hypothetical protein
MARKRTLIMLAAGTATAAGAAVIAVNVARHTEERRLPSGLAEIGGATSEICLKAEIALVEGAEKKCYAPPEIAGLLGRAVLNNDGAPVALQLSHPTDDARAPETVTTCSAYEARTGEGWRALTTREMSREAYFIRACGVLAMLRQARFADVSYFKNGALTEEDVRALAAASAFGIGEGGGELERVEHIDETSWRLSFGDQYADIQEFAHADFNADGRADMAVFINLTVMDGTARAGLAGYLDKPPPPGAVRFIEWRQPPAR